MTEVAEPLRFRVEPTEQDWLSANRLILRHTWLWRRLALAFAILWAAYAALLIGINSWNYGWSTHWALHDLGKAAIYSAIAVLVLVALTLALLPRRVRRQLADTRRLSAGADVEVEQTGIRFDTGIASVALTWNQFKRWHENPRVLVLAMTEREVLLLPKAQVAPTTIDTVRNHLIAAQVERGLT